MAFGIGLAAALVIAVCPAAAAASSCQTSGPASGSYAITVCLDQPAAGSTLSGDATVSGSTATASGTAPAAQRLAFYVDGVYALTDYGAPYTFSLPTARWVDGSHRIEVEALLRDGFITQRTGVDVTFDNGVTTVPVNTKQWSPTSGTTPAAGKPFVLAATGDGAGGETSAQTVVDRIKSWSPNLFLYLGDVYEKGAPTEFKNWYGSASSTFYGQFRSITDPVIGNHEYSASPAAAGYFDFWDNIPHYYSFNANGWHFIALDSTSQFGQTASGSPMYNWLQDDLKKNQTTCMVAYWHHPPFNIGPEGYATRMDEIWNLLASHHVAMVLTGHDHDYQRWVPLDGTGQASSTGVTEFVAGSGGHSEQSFVGTDSRVAAAFSNTQFGALRMELNPAGAGYQFVTAAGQRLDSGSVQCPGTPKDATAPTAPSRLTAIAQSRAEIDLSWNQAGDNVGVTGYDVYRNGSLLKSIGPDTTFVDGTVASKSTYTYTVKARDAAGNASPAGNSSSATTPALGALFYDGFETNDLTQWTNNNTGMTTVSSPVFSGSFAARAVNAGANQATWVTKKLAAPQTSLYYQARVRIANQGTSPVNLMRFRSSASSPASLLSVMRSVSGKISVRNEVTATTTTSAKAVLATGSWHTIQAHVVIDGTSSQVETWFDGVKVGDLSFTLSLGTTPIGSVDLGEFTKGRTYDVAFDEVAADTSPIPDATAPTAPTSVQATSASGLQVDLSWAASSDDVGVAAYDVYRNGALVASPAGTSTTWTDTTVSPQSSYFYRVRARDGAGNTSGLSDMATITTGPAFSDGFETGDMSQWTTSSGMTPQSATGFSGSYAARATASLAPASAAKTLPSAPAELYYRVRFKILSQGATSPVNLLRFRTAAGLAIYTVSVSAGGTLQARNDVTGVITSSTTSVASGVWHEVQAHLLVEGETGQSDVWLDGTALPSFTRADNFGSAGIGRLELGDSTGTRTFDVQFDDVLAASGFINDDTPPTPPASLSTSSVAGNQLTLSWIPATDNIGVTSYDVYRDGLVLQNIAPAGSYTDTTVQPGATYRYEVRANDAAGNTSDASDAITVTTPGLDTKPPTAPTLLTAIAVSPTEVDLTWKAATDDVGVTAYKIFRNDNVLTTVSGSTLSYQDRNVAGDNTYAYAVQAADAAGNSSPNSDVASVTTPHQPLFVDGFESGSLSPNWTVAGGVSVQQQQVATGAWAAHATTTSAATWAWHALVDPQNDVDYSMRFRSAAVWSGTTALLKLRTGTGTSLFGVQVSSAGKLQVRNDVVPKTTTSTTVVSTGTWHLLEAHLVVSGTSSTVSVTLDGAPVSDLSLTGDFGTTPVERVQFGDNSGGKTFDLYFDDIAVETAAATTPPVNAAPPVISGSATDQSTLAASTGTWTGSAPMVPTYQWRDCDSAGFTCTDIPGATGSTYTLRSSDVGQTIKVAVTEINAAGSASATSAATAVVAASPPSNTIRPTITGTTGDGGQLTAARGTWSGSTPLAYAYQWRRCDSNGTACTDIDSATDTAYTLTQADVGSTIVVAVTATNAAGSATATSLATSPIGGAPPASTSAPSISGTAKDGQTLTADPGTWSGSTPLSYAYEWRRCDASGSNCAAIAAATAATYTLTPDDVGSTIVVAVTASNSGGSSTAVSSASGLVAGIVPANTTAPSIAGTPDGVSTLSADPGTWSGSTPIDYAYQWQSCARDASGCADISGATSAEYRPAGSDVGNVLRVQVTASNVAGSARATSDVTAPVSASGPVNTTAPSISGTMLEGQTLTADNGTWTGTAPIGYGYQWRHCNSDGSGCTNVAGATSSTYALSTYDSGATLDVLVTATNTAGSTVARSANVTLRTRLFADGFESGTLANWTNFGLTTQQTNVFAGSWAARSISTAGTASYATAVLPAAQSDLTYRLHFKGNTAWPSTGVYLMKLRTATNASIVGVSVSSGGRLAYRNDVAAAATTTTTSVSSGVWHEIAVHVTIAGTSGSIDMTLDGAHAGGLPKIENFGTAPVGKIQVGDNSTGRNFDVASDEVVVGNDS